MSRELLNKLTKQIFHGTKTGKNGLKVDKISNIEVKGLALHFDYLRPDTEVYRCIINYDNADFLQQDVEQLLRKQAILKSISELL